MTILHSIVLGVVEGVTEFLPISSTGHLILASKVLRISESDFQKSFEIIIQLGAIASVIVLYWRRFLNSETLKRLAVAFVPTGLIGLLFYSAVKTYLLGNLSVVLWTMLVGGIALVLFEKFHNEPTSASTDINSLSYKQCAMIGLCQSVAIVPGVSRSAATIVGGLVMGLKRTTIVEFSFLLAVPTMLAATGLDLVKNASLFTAADAGMLAVGFIVSFVVALGSIQFLLNFIRTRSFTSFGVYRILVALLFFLLILK